MEFRDAGVWQGAVGGSYTGSLQHSLVAELIWLVDNIDLDLPLVGQFVMPFFVCHGEDQSGSTGN